MTRRPALLAGMLLALLLTAPLLHAQQAEPPAVAETIATDELRIAHWVGNETQVADDVDAGRTASLWFAVAPANDRTPPPPPPPTNDTAGDGNATANGNQTAENNQTAPPPAPSGAPAWIAVINVSSTTLNFTASTLDVIVPANATAWGFARTQFSTTDAPAGPASYTFTVTVREGGAEGEIVATATGTGTITIADTLLPEPPTDIPLPLLVGGAAVLILGAGGAAYALKQRREREAIRRAPRRSQALREETLEREAVKRPERVQEVQREIRQQERVRETRRELQILEAKRADAQKTIDLLKKRHEAGGLTRHQYEKMVEKKRGDLERIEAEIAEMESQGDSGAAA